MWVEKNFHGTCTVVRFTGIGDAGAQLGTTVLLMLKLLLELLHLSYLLPLRTYVLQCITADGRADGRAGRGRLGRARLGLLQPRAFLCARPGLLQPRAFLCAGPARHGGVGGGRV